MEIFTSRAGRTFKSATFTGCFGVSDQNIIDTAMTHHNETPARLFGWDIERVHTNVATVTLYTG